MFNREYRFKFDLNARHAINSNDNSQIHPHIWVIHLTIRKVEDGYFNYRKIVQEINEEIAKYEGKFLNEIPPFDSVVPIMENISEIINKSLVGKLFSFGGMLVKTEISENPNRTFILNNFITETDTDEAGLGIEPLNEEEKEAVMKIAAGIGVVPGIGVVTEKNQTARWNDAAKTIVAKTSEPMPEPLPEPDYEKIDAIRRIIANSELIANTALSVEEPTELINAADSLAKSAKKLLRIETSKSEYTSAGNRKIDNDDVMYINIEPVAQPVKNDFSNTTETTEIKAGEPGEYASAVFKNVSADSENGKRNLSTSIDAQDDKEKTELQETGNKIEEDKGSNKKEIGNGAYIALGALILVLLAIPLFLWITRNGAFPASEGILNHLSKVDEIYNKFISGDTSAVFAIFWNNGLQMPNFWAPVPQAVIFITELITQGNQLYSYNVIFPFILVFGGLGWILLAAKTDRKVLGLFVAVLWFVFPESLRIIFVEGDLGRIFAIALIPFILLAVVNYFDKKSIGYFVLLVLMVALSTMSNFIFTAMFGLAMLAYLVIYGAIHKKLIDSLVLTVGFLLGILSMIIFYYVSVRLPFLGLDQIAFSNIYPNLEYRSTNSIDPLLRIYNPQIFYFGLPVVLFSILGLFIGDKKSKTAFALTLIIFLTSVTLFLPFGAYISIEHLYWLAKFAPIAIGLFLTGILLWRKANKSLLAIIIIILFFDCALSFVTLSGNNTASPDPGIIAMTDSNVTN